MLHVPTLGSELMNHRRLLLPSSWPLYMAIARCSVYERVEILLPGHLARTMETFARAEVVDGIWVGKVALASGELVLLIPCCFTTHL